jgi:hypothetical protein
VVLLDYVRACAFWGSKIDVGAPWRYLICRTFRPDEADALFAPRARVFP